MNEGDEIWAVLSARQVTRQHLDRLPLPAPSALPI